MRRFLMICAVVLTGCTPTQAMEVFSTVGVSITDDEAVAVSEWVNSQDCLPAYDSDHVVECAIRDSWHAYAMPVGLDTWARVAWCESGHNPAAKNPTSSATGLFQNLARYWPDRATNAGFDGGDIFDARTHAFVSAWLASSSGIHHWNPSKHCWG